MLEPIAAPALYVAPPAPTPLGLLDFSEIARALGVSTPTLERLSRRDATFPRLFKIGGKRFARLTDLQTWVDGKARGDAA